MGDVIERLRELEVEGPIEIIFDGPPSHTSGRFVEVERNGTGFDAGEWIERDDGLWALRLTKDPARNALPALLDIAEAAEEAKGYLDAPQPIIDRLWDALARLREMEDTNEVQV